MMILKTTSLLLLVGGSVLYNPTHKVKPRPPVELVQPAPPAEPELYWNLFSTPAPREEVAPAAPPPGYEDSYVFVEGLEGRLVLLRSIMEQQALSVGQRITQERMYELLRINHEMLR